MGRPGAVCCFCFQLTLCRLHSKRTPRFEAHDPPSIVKSERETSCASSNPKTSCSEGQYWAACTFTAYFAQRISLAVRRK
eukprot:6653786-Prymnesium_polylepis.1